MVIHPTPHKNVTYLQMTTVGYGDPVPANVNEILCAMLIEFVGVLFFAFVVGNIVKLFEKQSSDARRANMYREKMIEVSATKDRNPTITVPSRENNSSPPT